MTTEPTGLFHVSEYIQEAMDARGWGLEQLAVAMGGDAIQNYLTLELTFTPLGPEYETKCYLGEQTARQLAEAFGTSAEVWLNIDTAYREALKQHASDN